MADLACPSCKSLRLRTIDTRPVEGAASGVRRRKGCNACGHRFSTYETTTTPDASLRQVAAALAPEILLRAALAAMKRERR